MQKIFFELLNLTNTQVNKLHKNNNGNIEFSKNIQSKFTKLRGTYARALLSKVAFLSIAVFDSLVKYVLVSLKLTDVVSPAYTRMQKKICNSEASKSNKVHITMAILVTETKMLL